VSDNAAALRQEGHVIFHRLLSLRIQTSSTILWAPEQLRKVEVGMAHTFTQIYIQAVFAVAVRQSLIRPDFKEELQKYITGIVRKKGQKLIEINSMPDHTHMLIGLKPSISLSDLIRDVKSDSTEFIKRKGWIRGRFNWQEGFGAFSYSHSQLDSVIRYIRNQEKHHAKRSFRNEYLTLLKKFDIAYEPKYVFEFLTDE
jgi:REP element-mobilizing transposase RayT